MMSARPPTRLRHNTWLGPLLALIGALGCGEPTAPDRDSYYVLTSFDGGSVPYPSAPPSSSDTVYAALIGEQFYIESDTSLAWYAYDGRAHVQSDGRVAYEVTGCVEHWEFRYRLHGDTLQLTSMHALNLSTYRYPPAPILRSGSQLVVDNGPRRVYSRSRPLELTCG